MDHKKEKEITKRLDKLEKEVMTIRKILEKEQAKKDRDNLLNNIMAQIYWNT